MIEVRCGTLDLPPLCFAIPDTGSFFYDWTPHIPFLSFLMYHLVPRRYVELGVLDGNSYFAACEAVRLLGIPCECVGIDPWEGDFKPEVGHQAKPYSATFYQSVAMRNGGYAKFSRLVRATSNDALAAFADNSIDLLHIDANHVYDAVKSDYETWYPKVSENGVVLIHDTRNTRVEVGKLWNEIVESGAKTYENRFGHGLGVVFKGTQCAQIAQLYESSPSEVEQMDAVFESLGWLVRFAQEGARKASAQA
jgi:hypothetical protein